MKHKKTMKVKKNVLYLGKSIPYTYTVHTHVYTQTFRHTYVYIHTLMHTCTHAHTYSHVHIHTCTYVHAHVLEPALTVCTYITDKSVEEVNVEDDSMNATKRDIEEEPGEGGVVIVTHTVVDPGTMVVHLHNTSAERGKERREGCEEERKEREWKGKRGRRRQREEGRGGVSPATLPTVMGTGRLKATTHSTILQVLLILCIGLETMSP